MGMGKNSTLDNLLKLIHNPPLLPTSAEPYTTEIQQLSFYYRSNSYVLHQMIKVLKKSVFFDRKF